MAIKLRILRGTATAVAAYTADEGQLVLDLDNKILYVHDGLTVGGYRVSGVPEGEIQALIDGSISQLHTHNNLTILDKFSEVNGTLCFDGAALQIIWATLDW